MLLKSGPQLKLGFGGRFNTNWCHVNHCIWTINPRKPAARAELKSAPHAPICYEKKRSVHACQQVGLSSPLTSQVLFRLKSRNLNHEQEAYGLRKTSLRGKSLPHSPYYMMKVWPVETKRCFFMAGVGRRLKWHHFDLQNEMGRNNPT